MKYELRISDEVFEKFPYYQALVIYAEDLTNGESDDSSLQTLRHAETHVRDSFQAIDVTEHPHIAAWREAFRKFGAKPKKYLCGAEALIRRVLAGESIKGINRIVDIYNAISIRYAIPVGGEDWEGLRSDLWLKEASGNEPFEMISFGSIETTSPRTGEIIWADSAGCTVRRWNWRQTIRTAVTVKSRNCYFVLDRLEPLRPEELQAAGEHFCKLLTEMCPEAKIRSSLLKADCSSRATIGG